jgi:hypothetical protein
LEEETGKADLVVDEATLRRELKRLRRDEGRTLLKLQASPVLRAALGDPPDSELRERFDTAVQALGADLKSVALRNAYAIGLAEPGTLISRRKRFGEQKEVWRGPDAIKNWEDEKIDELVALLRGGTLREQEQDRLVAVAITGGIITVVAEGAALSGRPMLQRFNPNRHAFIPAFIYQLSPLASPRRLTICGLFIDAAPARVFGEASGDLLAFVCGDGRQELDIKAGGLPGIEAAAHVAVHYDDPIQGVFYGFTWTG